LFALPLTTDTLATYRKHTGRQNPPEAPAREAWLVVGRRGGKSLISALVAVFLACFRNYNDILAPGERGTVMIIAEDRRQARVVFRYITGFLDTIPMLRRMVESKTKESVELSNRVTIEIHTSSFRTVRGYTIIAAICDEIAFWPAEDSANPDTEILNGLRPGMATIPDSLMLSISSPYARRGALFEAYRQHFGRDGDPVLVWQADTRAMNDTVSAAVIAEAYERDAPSATAEYGAQFRTDVESFISFELAQSAVIAGRLELPFVKGVRYFGFTDPSGGSSDSMTLGIAHVHDARVVLDLFREVRPPFSPEATARDFASLLKAYRVSTVAGDRYAGEWPREQFRKYGIQYEPAEQTKSEIYLELLPAISSHQVELLDSQRLIAQLCGLERRTARGGRDSVDHGPGAHDDLINAGAGALTLAMKSQHTDGLFELWREQAEKSKGVVEPLGPEEEAKRRGDAQMVAAGRPFGTQLRPTESVRRVQESDVAQTSSCPTCGNRGLARASVQGPSGDVEERCSCGWSNVVKRKVLSVRG
jgi:hypothetical protein